MRHSKNQRDSAGSFSRRLLFCYIYTIVHEPVVRLKTEHHAICVTQENLPTTNIYILTSILTIQISNQEMVETIMFKSKSNGTCCTSYLFFLSVLRYEI